MRRRSLNKSIAARTSYKRYVRHNLGFKAPRGWGWVTNPKKAAYNRAYYRKNKAEEALIGLAIMLVLYLAAALVLIAWQILKGAYYGISMLAAYLIRKYKSRNLSASTEKTDPNSQVA